jgi:hypothetical protein
MDKADFGELRVHLKGIREELKLIREALERSSPPSPETIERRENAARVAKLKDRP